MRIWECKIGIEGDAELPFGADSPMREAVKEAFLAVLKQRPDFLFSGWGASLTQVERDVIDHQKRVSEGSI